MREVISRLSSCATNYEEVIEKAAECRYIEVVQFCKEFLGYDAVHDELLKYHHKQKFPSKVYEELTPITWHHDRVWDCCFDEEQKHYMW